MSKLVEILARELEEWPEGVKFICQCLATSKMRFVGFKSRPYRQDIWRHDQGNCFEERAIQKATDHATAIVTREMWEAERAKFQVLEWNGEGLPPAGTLCEAWYDDGRECWHKGVIVGPHPDLKDYAAIAIKKGSQTDALIWSSQFRPTPTDREKWIEAAKRAIQLTDAQLGYIYDAGLAKLPD